MPPAVQVRVKTAAGALAGVMVGDRKGFYSLSYERRVNSPGAFGMYLARTADETLDTYLARVNLFELDGQIEVWWRWPEYDIDWALDFEGFVRDINQSTTIDGADLAEIGGRGYVDLLSRRIIYATAGSAGANKTGAAETVAKGYVNEQASAGAGARAFTGLAMQADAATGNTVTRKYPYNNLLGAVQEIADIGGGDFDVVGTGAATFQFNWYNGQRGTDRSATVIFSEGRGNMGSPSLNHSRHAEVNAVLVAGQGEGASRMTTWRTDAARIALSTWNRCERFLDQRQESAAGGLNSAGDIALDEGEPKKVLSFQVLQVPSCLLGSHYFFGDLVTASYRGVSATKQIAGYRRTWNESGLDTEVYVGDQ